MSDTSNSFLDSFFPPPKTELDLIATIDNLINNIQHVLNLKSDTNANDYLTDLIRLTDAYKSVTINPCSYEVDRKNFRSNILKCLDTNDRYFREDFYSENYNNYMGMINSIARDYQKTLFSKSLFDLFGGSKCNKGRKSKKNKKSKKSRKSKKSKKSKRSKKSNLERDN